ncbi:Protein Hikeshi [Taenia solium]|eukprot:TsM_000652600 transcript=TsM_000652600 gene=TsM_000652600
MFAALLTGQIVQSNFVEVSPGRLLLDLPPLGKSNHIVVFLTGRVPLPEGYGAGVHFGLVENGLASWSYLGYLSNNRPSAIFRVSGLKSNALEQVINPFQSISNMSIGNMVTAQLGISIELLAELAGQTSAIENSSNSAVVDDNMRFTQFAAENLYHFAAGCAQEVPGTSEAYVPISAVKRWYDTIWRKLSLDPNFWKK